VRFSVHTAHRVVPARTGVTLVELVFALALTSGIMLALGHVVTQLTHGVMSQERRAQNQSEAALAVMRLRTELRQAVAINTLTSQKISFAHPDATGDGAQDVITYDWNGTPGSDLTRDINGGGAEAVLSQCAGFNLVGLGVTPVDEELLSGHVAYGPPVTSTGHEATATSNNWVAEVFTPSRTGASSFRVTRIRLFLRPLSFTGSVVVGLRHVSGTNPGGAVEYVTRPLSQLSPSGAWEDFRFSGSTSYATGSSWAIVIRCDTAGGSVGVRYDEITSTVPADSPDYYRSSSTGGLVWLPLSNVPARDLRYLVYGRCYSSAGSALAMNATRIDAVEMRAEAGPTGATVKIEGAVQCVNLPEQVQ
jgi:hypothetical protein